MSEVVLERHIGGSEITIETSVSSGATLKLKWKTENFLGSSDIMMNQTGAKKLHEELSKMFPDDKDVLIEKLTNALVSCEQQIRLIVNGLPYDSHKMESIGQEALKLINQQR